MSSKKQDKIIRKRVGEIPILQTIADRLKFREILTRYIKPHKNEKISAVDSILLLVYNIACGRQPLYEIDEWVNKLDIRLFGFDHALPVDVFNDDRFARVLDKVFNADRATMATDIALNVVQELQLDLSQLHNDSTTVKTCGKMPGKSRTGLFFTQGHSKDHRPDLKQIVYNLTISADGAVPVHFKSYPGNQTDDTTHIETWNTLRRIVGKPDFLYVADCKVCTNKQLTHIVKWGGRVVTLMPNTWKESYAFKEELRTKKKAKKLIMRRLIPNSRNKYESFYCYSGRYYTEKANYPLYWIYSTEKKKRDRLSREKLLQKVDHELTALLGKINMRNLKTREQIMGRVQDILQLYGVSDFYNIEIKDIKEKMITQIGRGRPGKTTKYKTTYETIYSLYWTRDREAINREKNIDGIFPLICTDKEITAKEGLTAYKYQPRLEKRFSQFKSVHNAAPTLFKKVERVEAMMFLFFIALIMQAVIEREIRQKMKDNHIDAIPIYPEHRLAYQPTTAKIFDRFHDTSLYQLIEKNRVAKEYKDDLTDVQRKVLHLLGMSEESYWDVLNF